VVGTTGYVLTSNGASAPTWQVGGNATNINGGVAGSVPYQSAVSTTLFSGVGTTGQLLQSNGASAPTWITSGVMPQQTTASYRTNFYSTTVQIGSGQTLLINNAVSLTQYVTASNVTFPASMGQFELGSSSSGIYMVNFRVNLYLTGAILSSSQIFLSVASPYAVVGGTIQNYQYSTSSATSNITMEVNAIVPLVASTIYQVGTVQNYTGTVTSVTVNFCHISIFRLV